MRRIDPTVAASSVRWLPDVIAAAIAARRFNADLMAIAGCASLGIALVGVYAITAFSLARRTREIGIRLTLGATPGQLLRPLLRTELQAVVVGVSIGCLGAIVVSRVLSHVLFAVGPLEPATIAACASLLMLSAFTAIYLPIRRALEADPILALRAE